MISQSRYGIAALVLGLVTGSSLYACSSDDETGVGGSGASSTTSHGGAGAQGGAAGHGAQGGSVGGHGGAGALGGNGGAAATGGAAGSGGAPLSSSETCLQVCEAEATCINGQGGAGGAGGGWVQSCIDPCIPSLATCTAEQLEALLACLTPHIQPDCNLAAYNVCANTVGCVDNG